MKSLNIFRKALKENDQLAEEFVLNSCTDELKELDEEILKVFINLYKSSYFDKNFNLTH